jgi:uncharacterized protein (TIGR02421 family)
MQSLVLIMRNDNTTMIAEKEADRIRHVSDLLHRATQSIQILGHISWPRSAREQFFEKGARELPVVNYPQFDPSGPVDIISEARGYLKDSRVDAWLNRQANFIEKTALMLSACGTPDFFKYSSELYGKPLDILPDQVSTPYALAMHFDKQIQSIAQVDLGAPRPKNYPAEAVAAKMEKAVKAMFNDEAPAVLVVDELSANALAGPKRIRIRRSASFSDKDVDQLINHEAYIHVVTALNAVAQPDLKILRASHPGTTKTQEGLAVFAEFITGSMDFDRMQRLADRVLAIQMTIEGADFLDVYQYFLERTGIEGQAYENARRVFRGGVLSGGAPFTKDIVYLDGLLRVHTFLKSIVSSGRVDCLRLLFCGKLDIEDIPILYELSERGLCRPPKYLPPWANDMRYLLCHLTYSSFLNGMDLGPVRAHYDALLGSIPKTGH